MTSLSLKGSKKNKFKYTHTYIYILLKEVGILGSKKRSKKTNKESLKRVPSDRCFYICDGNCCASLLDLSEAIHIMNDEAFAHHVNDAKNDFANWVEAVFDQPKLAKSLRDAKSKEKHVVEILRFVVREMK